MEFTREDAQIVLGAIITLIVPVIVSYLKNPTLPDWAKWLLSVGVSAVGGFLTVYSTTGLDTGRIAVAIVAIALAAQGHYKVWFEKTALEERLRAMGPFSSPEAAAQARGEDTLLDYEGTPRGS